VSKKKLPKEFEPLPPEFTKAKPKKSGAMEIVQDISLPAAQGVTMNFLDEIVGGTRAAVDKFGGSKEPFLDLAEKHAIPVRQAYKESIERSPVLATGSEIVGSMLGPGKFTPGIKGVLKAAGLGAASAVGASEDKLSKEAALGAAVGAGLGGASTLLTKASSRAIPRDADVARAKVLGAGKKELGEVGVKERANIAKELKKKGFFTQGNTEFEPMSGKFKKAMSIKPTKAADIDIPIHLRLKDRAEDAISKIEDAKNNLWPAAKNKIIPDKDVDTILSKAVGEYTDKNPLYSRSLETASKVKDELVDTLRLRGQERAAVQGTTYQGITLKDLDELKSQLYSYTSFGKSAADMPDSDIMYRSLARNLKEKVNKEIGSPKFAELNELQSKLLTVSDDLASKTASTDASTRRNIFDKWGVFLGDTLAGDDAAMAGATTRELLDKIPYAARESMSGVVEEAPGTIFRQQFVTPEAGPEEELPTPGRNPGSVTDTTELPPEFEPAQTEPPQPEVQPTEIPWGQGVNLGEPNIQDKIFETLNPQPMTFNPYVNEEILNTPLPRDTERLIANPMVLKAKLSQAAPQHLPMLEDMLQNDPEGIRKAAPMIAQLVPSMFERDEYNAFDGKIVDPQMQQKFMVDLKRDEALSSIEKARLATRVRRGEPV
jgi:hypothetical protein